MLTIVWSETFMATLARHLPCAKQAAGLAAAAAARMASCVLAASMASFIPALTSE